MTDTPSERVEQARAQDITFAAYIPEGSILCPACQRVYLRDGETHSCVGHGLHATPITELTPMEAWAEILARPDNDTAPVTVPPYGNVMATPDNEADHVALQVICRVFADWEPVYERWLAYDKSQWLWAGRALGGFLRGEVDRERAAVRAEERARGRKVLAKMEWASYTNDPDGRFVECCPSCRGINPADRMATSFRGEAVGHRTNCALLALLTDDAP